MAHVTFVHGIANKPDADVLLRLWRDALAADDGVDLGAEGITSSMVYWADVLYEEPAAEQAEHESNDSIVAKSDPDVEMDWRSAAAGSEQAWIESLAEKLSVDEEPPGGDPDFTPEPFDGSELEANFERIPLPWWLKKRLMKKLLRDVHHYLFNVEYQAHPDRRIYKVQDEIRRRFVAGIAAGAEQPGPHIVVSHSMGTVIAYDCLKRVQECASVDALMTIGSPLGIDEVQDKLRPEWSRDDGYPAGKLAGEWINVFDRLDPVAGFDAKLANDFKRGSDAVVDDLNEQNWGRWRHNIAHYLAGPELRKKLARVLGLD